MKLIRRGVIPDEIMYIGTCIYCNSLMEARQDELECYNSRRGTLRVAPCPVCTRKVHFNKKRIFSETPDIRESICNNPSQL